MKSDSQIVEATLAGDSDLFAEIVRRYQEPLMRVAVSRLRRADWAEDVVQETFYWAYKCLASYDARYSFRTWLWTILLNQCSRHQKKHGRQPAVTAWTDHTLLPSDSSQESLAGCDAETPPQALLAKERNALLYRQLAMLSDEEADALRLRFFGGLKFQEIADAMGCSLSCAKIRVRRGLTKMSQRLAADGQDRVADNATHSESQGE